MELPDFSKKHYVVTWCIDEWADTPLEAAKKALKDMPNEKNLTTAVFDVEEYDKPTTIDLETDS